MKYKELINAELGKLGFTHIEYDGNAYNKYINEINANYENIFENDKISLSNKICLVSSVNINSISDQRVLGFTVSFIDIDENCKDILDNLLISNYSGNIMQVQDKIINNEFQINLIVERSE